MSELDVNAERSRTQSPEPSPEPRPKPSPEPSSEPSPARAPSGPTFAVATQPTYARTLFLGPDGLRPGWGLVFYAVVYSALRQISLLLAHPTITLWTLADECSLFLAATIPAVFLARIERRPWRSYGLAVQRALEPSFWKGILWGFSAISLLMVALYEVHAFDFGHLVLHGLRLAKFGSFWAAMFLAVGLYEEFFFRGYSQFTLARGTGFWPAALALSALFGWMHLGNPGEQWQGALAAAAIGLFFCFTLRRTGSLWFAVGFHAAWDWGETFFYSVPDSGMKSPGHLLSSSLHGADWLSGGSVGPEGSVFCFVVIALTWIAFEKTHPAASVRGHREIVPLPATAGSSSLRSSE
ncbi:MAG TPA: type II CAAX endopeptidase family protein [Candidatus Binatus sp.]|nr:type II CAAX endopeptidase family protein [Candidatus Binatus sp.]